MLYDLVATLLRPVAWWGSLRTQGLETVPEHGPVLVAPNHDSQWDPVLVGLAVRPRRRLRFLARASLWRSVTVALCAVRGTTEYARFPRRPRVGIEFFAPEGGDPRPEDTPAEVATRLLAEIRARVPPTPAGRRPRVGGPPRVRRARARRASRS
jgi:hypothetical protein